MPPPATSSSTAAATYLPYLLPLQSASDSHSSTWRKFSISKLFAKHAPPGSDDDGDSPSKAEGLTMSGMMRETEKR